ncbi:MAG: hypothetical protein CMJ82_03480 [Planctomycetaceae bacterium]|nr:hypothetical protein [Planctomycetaceae bacterium]|tara:strand:- start:1575 stop:2948 length:1374 start_codon:yes stop_codon:yes gene_type:complete
MTDSPRDINELISGYMDGQLSAEDHALAETALQTDVTAAKVLADLQALRCGIRALGEQAPDSTEIVSLAEQVMERLDGKSDAVEMKVVPVSVQAQQRGELTTINSKQTANHWSVYLSVVAVLFAVIAIWQVVDLQQDDSGNSIVSVDGETNVPDDGKPTDHQTDNPDEQIVGDDSSQLVDNNPGLNPLVPDQQATDSDVPEVPKSNELVNVPEIPKDNSLAGQPDLSVLTNGKFLFVIEIGVTPEGVDADVVREVLMKNGIVYDGGLDVIPELEQQLLQSRFLNGVVQNEDQPVGGTVDLIYMVASGLQVDQTRLDIHARHNHIAQYRFNMALLPKDIGVFDNLYRTVKSQWASTETSPKVDEKTTYQQQLKEWKGKAGQLMTTLYFLAGKGAAISKVGVEIPPVQAVPKGANRGDLKQPAPTDKPILGADLICEVLLVVRNMTAAEVERLPDVEKQ